MEAVVSPGSYNGQSYETGDGYNYENTVLPPYHFNVVPFQVENSLDFIDIFEDGTALLGSSNINGKYWNGSIWSFKDADLAPVKEKCLTGFGLEHGVTCGKFLGNSQNVIIGDEGGGLSIIRFQELTNAVQCMPLVTSYCYDQAVSSLSVSRDNRSTVSSSADSSIIISENESLTQIKKYSPAHCREVSCVRVSKFHNDLIFGSTSLDGSALIWDLRDSKPAYSIKEEEAEPLTSFDWKNENEVAFSTNFGSLYLFDLRNHQVIKNEKVMNIPIVYISFNKNGLLAAAGVWNDTIVWDFESKTTVYKDSRHSGVIRHLCWHPDDNRFYTCGDKKIILRHDIDVKPCSK